MRELVEVERWMGKGPHAGYRVQPNCECHQPRVRVRRRGLTFVVERETTQTLG